MTALALRDALEWGAELSYVPADADDWPQIIYAKLGFEPVGVQNGFVRRELAGRRSREPPNQVGDF